MKKTYYWFLVAAILLAICFLSCLIGTANALFFPTISLIANIVLLTAVFAVLNIAKIHFERWQIGAVVCTYLLFTLLTVFTVANRSFIYYWDYSNYVVKQINIENAFRVGVKPGIYAIIRTFYDDYTNFINIFTEFPYCLTSRTGDAYLYCQLINIFIPLLVLISALIEKVGNLIFVPHRKIYFICALAVLVSFPPLRYAFLLGQPDWFGLIFSISIVLLTIDYNFEKTDYLRYVLILAATAALIFTRRWYLYFILAYYITYGVSILYQVCSRWRSDSAWGKKVLKNVILYAAVCAVLLGILFFPMIQHILAYNYGERYAFYNAGGLYIELQNQIRKLDIFLWTLLGIVILKKKTLWVKPFRSFAAIHLCSLLLAIVMFTRVQNIGQHQELMLVPCYFVIFLLAIAAVMFVERKKYLGICAGLCAASCLYSSSVLVSNLAFLYLPPVAYEQLQNTGNELLRRHSEECLDGVRRDDIAQINALVNWIEDNTAEDDIVYFIPHNSTYNPDILINSKLPDQRLRSQIAFGFDVPGVHPFPVIFFDAKYVITATPFPMSAADDLSGGKLSPIFNNVFLSHEDERFRFVESIDMGNQYTMQIYERIMPVDMEEVAWYLEAFAEYDAQFPDLCSEIIMPWVQEHELQAKG